MFSRRQFLTAGATLGMASAFGHFFRLASANPKQKAKKLIIVFNYGGWDPSLVFDPKPDSKQVDMAQGKVKRFKELPVWVDSSRDEVQKFFGQWGGLCAVVNGIGVRSLVHEECVEQVLTGESLQEKADIGAYIASKANKNVPIPYLTLGPQAKPHIYSHLSAEFGFTNQLSALAVPQLAYPKPGSQSPHPSLSFSNAEDQAVQAYLKGQLDSFAKEYGESGRNGRRIADFQSAKERARLLEDFLQKSSLAEPKIVFRFSQKYPIAVKALQENFSKVAFLQTDGWDTHSNVSQQESMYNDLFGGLNGMMHLLHKNKMLDDTLVLVLSEMGRTPKLNAQKGKDHWPYTSAMLIGKGVNGGRVYGSTDQAMRPKPISLRTGQFAKSGGVDLRMPHVLSAVLKLMDLPSDKIYPNAGVLDAIVG